jgi:2-phospho-L-lactate guanylyltransferase (CobY/MobA/RfbA family)
MSVQPDLLVFTLGPSGESRRHRLLAEGRRRDEIWLRQACLESAVEAGRTAGCRVTICSPSPLPPLPGVSFLPQASGSFGERLVEAMGSLAARRPAPLIVAATDVPDLAPRHLEAALELIEQDPERVVLGPSPDGGIYLLALGRPLPDLARQVRWNGAHVLADLLRLLRFAGRPAVVLGEALRDLDRPSDLEGWLASATDGGPSWRSVRRQLEAILEAQRRPLLPSRMAIPHAPWSAACAGRAPPLSISL